MCDCVIIVLYFSCVSIEEDKAEETCHSAEGGVEGIDGKNWAWCKKTLWCIALVIKCYHDVEVDF